MSTITKTPAKVTADQFAGTRCSTAADKAKAVNAYVRFVRSGFKKPLFTRAVYTFLHVHLSFIAHYDRDGFYYHFFTSEKGLSEFMWEFERRIGTLAMLDPERWSDVASLFDPDFDGRFASLMDRAALAHV